MSKQLELGSLDQKPKQPYRGIYNPSNPNPFKLSRSKIELFIQCPRCFYIDRRLGIGRPSIPAFLLNSAVDTLFKKEFDIHRLKAEAHPIMTSYKIDAIPFTHKDLNRWRENFVGLEYWHKPTNLWLHGAIDDVWQSPNGELIVVDYKSTAKESGPSIEGFWQQSYKRQLEIYQWLLSKLGFDVAKLGYFVYANGRTDRKAFDKKLEFDVTVIPYEGDTSWVENKVMEVHSCLNAKSPPKPHPDCEHCGYFKKRALAKL